MFDFELGETVKLAMSDEKGEIKARAEYLHSENCYLILYMAGDGRQVTSWWGESEIEYPEE